jgi:threonine aldolase
MRTFDLRSDTVTRPSAEMRKAMAEAEVGDDVFREDPTVQRLERRTAEIVGKEGALFVPSGTMANQIALLCQTRPGDEVICGRGAHAVLSESGASAAWSGVQMHEVGTEGVYTVEDARAAIMPSAYWSPRTRLVSVENTHTRAGGRVFPQTDAEAIATLARAHGLALHLDGARIWNAAAATGRAVHELCAPFDTVSVCFSKGLGAPVGSAICGSAAIVEAAVRFRKMLGGGMRQAGILAAGALYALEHNRARLTEDHDAARRLGEALAELDGVSLTPVETNIVNLDVPVSAARVSELAEKRGVLFHPAGPHTVRLVTHLEVSGPGFDACLTAAVGAIREALG